MMNLRRIDLNLLVVFEALVSEANVSRAARRLHLSQSALSHALSRLREAFGDPILERQGRVMMPTPRALAALPEVRSLLSQVGRLFAHGGRFNPATAERTFHVGASDYAAATVLPRLLPHIHAQAPSLRLRVHHAGRVNAPALLRSGELDLALGVFNHLTDDLVTQPVYAEPYLCAVDAQTGTAGPLSRQDYLNGEHINVLVQGDTLGVVDEALARQGLTRRISLTVPHFSTALALLSGTQLIYTGPAGLFRPVSLKSSLRTFPAPFELPPFPTLAAWSVRNQNDEGLRWLCQHLYMS